jgi:hypothetical protein
MTRLSERKTKLSFTTEATARYRRKERNIIVETDGNGFAASVRLAGTRQRYDFSWRWLFDHAAELHARRERERRKQERAARRKGLL